MSQPLSVVQLKPVPGISARTFTVIGSVKLIDSTINFDPSVVRFVQVEFGMNTHILRYRCDGTSPTSSVGHLRGNGAIEFMSIEKYLNMRFIRADVSSGDPNVIVTPLTI